MPEYPGRNRLRADSREGAATGDPADARAVLAALDHQADELAALADRLDAAVRFTAATADRLPAEEPPAVPTASEDPPPWYVTLTNDQRGAILDHLATVATPSTSPLGRAIVAIVDAQRGCAACGEPDGAHVLDLDHAEDWQPQHRYIAPEPTDDEPAPHLDPVPVVHPSPTPEQYDQAAELAQLVEEHGAEGDDARDPREDIARALAAAYWTGHRRGQDDDPDALALDQLAGWLRNEEWPGASGMEDVAAVVGRVRDLTSGPVVEWRRH